MHVCYNGVKPKQKKLIILDNQKDFYKILHTESSVTRVRGGTNRKNLCRVGYRERKLRSGPCPGRVYLMQVGKSPQYFQVCSREMCRVVANRFIGQQLSKLWHHKDCSHKENGTLSMENTVILVIRNLALNPVGYLGSSFAHPLPDVSGSGQVFVPPLLKNPKNSKIIIHVFPVKRYSLSVNTWDVLVSS